MSKGGESELERSREGGYSLSAPDLSWLYRTIVSEKGKINYRYGFSAITIPLTLSAEEVEHEKWRSYFERAFGSMGRNAYLPRRQDALWQSQEATINEIVHPNIQCTYAVATNSFFPSAWIHTPHWVTEDSRKYAAPFHTPAPEMKKILEGLGLKNVTTLHENRDIVISLTDTIMFVFHVSDGEKGLGVARELRADIMLAQKRKALVAAEIGFTDFKTFDYIMKRFIKALEFCVRATVIYSTGKEPPREYSQSISHAYQAYSHMTNESGRRREQEEEPPVIITPEIPLIS